MGRLLCSGIGCAMALALNCGSADAIQVYELDGEGNRTLVEAKWSAYGGNVPRGVSLTDRTGAEKDWELLLGVKDFGTQEQAEQTQGLYGAGVEFEKIGVQGYRIEFLFDGYTWDAYSTAHEDGVARGYWDLFAVNLNQRDFYWNLVAPSDEETALLRDPLLTPDPSGGPVVSQGPLPGVTWGWGGADYGDEGFEQLHGSFWIELKGDTGLPYFLSVVLDTNTPVDADSAYPSWGGFDARSPVPAPTATPEPATLVLFGSGVAALARWRSIRRR